MKKTSVSTDAALAGGRRRYTAPSLSAFGAVAELTRQSTFSCSNDGNTNGCITDPGNMGKMAGLG